MGRRQLRPNFKQITLISSQYLTELVTDCASYNAFGAGLFYYIDRIIKQYLGLTGMWVHA